MAAKIMVYTHGMNFTLNEIQRHLESIRAMANPQDEAYDEVMYQVNKSLNALYAPIDTKAILRQGELIGKASRA